MPLQAQKSTIIGRHGASSGTKSMVIGHHGASSGTKSMVIGHRDASSGATLTVIGHKINGHWSSRCLLQSRVIGIECCPLCMKMLNLKVRVVSFWG